MTKFEKPKSNKFFIIFIFILIIGICSYLGLYYFPKNIIMKEYNIINKKIPINFHGLKIIHFTDLHYKTTIFEEGLSDLVNMINKMKPDIVVFTGDIFEKDIIYTEEDIESLKK